MSPASKRVAVVGAGPSGLTTVKALLEEGHRPTCFEKASSLGGVFRFGETEMTSEAAGMAGGAGDGIID